MIYGLLWLLFWETIQNIPSILGVVFTIKFWKHSNRYLKAVFPLLGGIGTVIMLGTFENIKLQVTTLPSESLNTIESFLIGTAAFSIFIFLAGWYYSAKWSNNTSDIIFGVSVALLLTVVEVWANVAKGDHDVNSFARVGGHTVAFLISFPVTVLLIRKASEAKGWLLFVRILAALAAMSAIIVVIDYLPFLR